MSIINELKTFAMRGNLIDMAVGFTVGAAFSTIAKSLVSDVVMPPVGLILGSSDFSDLFIVLKEGAAAAGPYVTLLEAQQAGAVTINFGLFVNSVIAFMLITIVMFFLIRFTTRIEQKFDAQFGDEPVEGEPTEKKCPYCRSVIHIRALRCPACTSNLDEVSAVS